MFQKTMCLVAVLVGLAGTARAGKSWDPEIRDALASYVREHGPRGLEFSDWSLRRGEVLPGQGKIVAVEKEAGSAWQETTGVRLEIESRPGVPHHVRLLVRLRGVRTVVVAARDLPIGHPVGPGDVREEIQEGRRVLGDACSRIEEVAGKKIWRPVSKGAALRPWHVRDQEGMESGDTVLIVGQGAGIEVQAPGKALQRGRTGEQVRVLNVLSGKEILATVVDPQTVSVAF
ncbi:MAG: flagellar basal body P-ring formation chaperone FlgA [bacterium]